MEMFWMTNCALSQTLCDIQFQRDLAHFLAFQVVRCPSGHCPCSLPFELSFRLPSHDTNTFENGEKCDG